MLDFARQPQSWCSQQLWQPQLSQPQPMKYPPQLPQLLCENKPLKHPPKLPPWLPQLPLLQPPQLPPLQPPEPPQLPQLPLLPNQKALAVHGTASTQTIKAIR